MQEWYKEDLAYIHDVGHSDFALKSAPGILEILTQNKVRNGLVVDLGCGSGLWAQELSKADYHVLGIDISEPLIAIARTRVPDAEFRVESLFKTDIPPCNAVTSIGECLNYLFDPDNNWQTLTQLFLRVYSALTPGGVFVFDIAEPGQVVQGNLTKGFSQGEDWVVLVEKEENPNLQTLTRRITSFRKIGEYYRRADEIHCLQLYKSTDIARELRRVGFQVSKMSSYGSYHLPKAHTAFLARKLV
ncbi:MAG: class I SAM-dependent methyltransferase [Chlorogloeopsis fritschii C42_A2020_084]|uniref:class I SAM-dependent methyltransferase n=1 Tax=Chlorogloeopsis fritschii TaxID=1124 RepID=UPI0019F071D5|nr:class I SAM-dependent methyltransferase [Chlorogloeopsis fritschii]MBF2005522.1 class I SAM-dependent methyltransferase [Chlorogloeopsis fritschii C42_A2020_084]